MVKISQNFVAFSEYMDFTLKRSRKNAIHISELFDIMAVGTGPSSRFWQISKPYSNQGADYAHQFGNCPTNFETFRWL